MNGYNFTERVRKVLAMAREQASQLRHEYVGTEHILLGMIAEGEGVGITVLENLDASPDELREMVVSTVKAGRAEDVTGPDLPYTSPAKKVLEFAMKEARDLNHSYVGTEHLLLGLLAENKGIAAQVLKARGVTLATARAEIVRVLGETPRKTSRPIHLPPSPVRERQGSLTPLSYTVEIAYDDGIAVRKRCTSREEALKFLMIN
ncbi:MAG: Clp protease N-terminal domain-containing protein [Gemmatimonadaceae bacterium]